MDNFNSKHFEVSPVNITSNNWREILIDIGLTHSTLQDFKSTESSGSYCFKESNSWHTPVSNRFIIWRIHNDIIELSEISLDLNLSGNQIKIRFKNTPLLDGVSIHETVDQVFIHIVTVASVHRLVLPHPRKLGNINIGKEYSKQLIGNEKYIINTKKSIFNDVSSETLRDSNSYYLLNHIYNIGASASSGMAFPVTASSLLTSEKESIFILGNLTGSLSIIKFDSSFDQGNTITWELKQVTMMGRIWNGLVPSIIRNTQEDVEAAVSIVSAANAIVNDHHIFVLSRDLKIRIWSYERRECLLIQSVLNGYSSTLLVNQYQSSNTSGTGTTKKGQQSLIHRPFMRKCSNESTSNICLGVFICTSDERQFILFEFETPAISDGLYRLVPFARIHAPEENINDFLFTSKDIWTIRFGSQSDISVLHFSIENSSEWERVALHNNFPAHRSKTIFSGPKEIFIDDIFWRGKFSLQTIAKAISIINGIPESNFSQMNIDMLIKEAMKLTENKMRAHIGSSELTSEEYTNIEYNCWEKLYSYCVQYHTVNSKPLGLLLDSNNGLIGVIKKSGLSFIEPVNKDDELLLSILSTPSQMHNTYRYFYEKIYDDEMIDYDTNTLFELLIKFSKNITEEISLEFEMCLINGDTVDKVVNRIVKDYLITAIDITSNHDEPLKQTFNNVFAKVNNIVEPIKLLLNSLNMEKDYDKLIENNRFSKGNANLSQYLSSKSGTMLLSESVKQICQLRYKFCRDLLLFQSFILYPRDELTENGTKANDINRLRNETIPLTSVYLQNYYLLSWISETPMQKQLGSNILNVEEMSAYLSIIEMNEFVNTNRTSFYHDDFGECPKTILYYFLEFHRNSLVNHFITKKLFTNENIYTNETWTNTLPSIVQTIIQLIWPKSTFLIEFLFGFQQYQLLSDYFTLTQSWCPNNIYTRSFFKGIIYLLTNEINKSIECFNEAVFGLNEEKFLQRFIDDCLQKDKLGNGEKQKMQLFSYYQKLIALFRINSKSESIIKIAGEGLTMILGCDNEGVNDEHSSSFLSTLFRCHLDLENISQAHQTMMLNPNYEQKKCLLRQFIVELIDNNKVEQLLSFSYGDLSDDFIAIIESKARASDLSIYLLPSSSRQKLDGYQVDITHNDLITHYEILYSYFVNTNNYRKAASVIYEFCQRLSLEVPGLLSLQKQVKCLALTLNCLKIVNEKYAWVVKPLFKELPCVTLNNQLGLNKRSLNGQDKNESYGQLSLVDSLSKSIDVYGIKEIRLEYMLTNIRLKLLRKDEKLNAVASCQLSVQETLTMLVNNMLFDEAFRLCIAAKMSFDTIFEGLCFSYVNLTQFTDYTYLNKEESLRIIDCLAENETSSLSYISNCSLSMIDKFWHLISEYIRKYEKDHLSSIHRLVTEKLLSSGIMIPSSLKLTYQKRNCSELLYLLMSYNFIEEAVSLAFEYIDAFLGNGTEYFDIESAINLTTSPLYFPHQHMTCLKQILENEKSDHIEYERYLSKLTDTLKRFQTASTNSSS